MVNTRKRLLPRPGPEKGLALLDLLVGVAITSAILSIVVLSVYQVIFRQADVRDSSKTVAALQETGHWISRDIMNAQYVDTSVPTQLKSTYTVQWPTQDGFQHVYTYDVTYVHAASKIRRNELVNVKTYNSDDGQLVSTTDTSRSTLVAENVTAFQAQLGNDAVRLSVTASAGDYTETRDYLFTLRRT